MHQAPDPLVQTLEDYVLLRPVTDDFRHSHIIIRVISPKGRESAVLNISDR